MEAQLFHFGLQGGALHSQPGSSASGRQGVKNPGGHSEFHCPPRLAGLTALYGWFVPGGWSEGHIVSTFGLHNSYAGYLLLAWPAAMAGAVLAQRWQWRAAYIAVALALALTLVLTFSRAAWLVLGLQALALLAFALWRAARRQARGEMAFAAGTGLTVLLLAGLLAVPQIRAHLLSITNFNDYSMQGRLRFWEAAWAMFRDHLLMGVGPGNFAYVFPQYQQDWRYYSVDPHSWVLQLLAELGIPGALIALAVLAGLALWTVRLWRRTGGSPLAAVFSIGVLGSLLHAAVDFDRAADDVVLELDAVGLAIGADRVRQRNHFDRHVGDELAAENGE